MSTDITKEPTFEEKMMKRIRDSIGDLVSDADLKRIIERGVDKALFERRVVKDGWHGRECPALVEECVTQFLEKRIREAVDKWITDNPEKMQAAVDAAIKAGIAGCVASTLDQKFSWMFGSLTDQLRSQGVLK